MIFTLSYLIHFGVATLNSWAKLKKLARDSIYKKNIPGAWSHEHPKHVEGEQPLDHDQKISKAHPSETFYNKNEKSSTDPPLLRKKWSL